MPIKAYIICFYGYAKAYNIYVNNDRLVMDKSSGNSTPTAPSKQHVLNTKIRTPAPV